MATDTSDVVEGFGQVSRTAGMVFRYVLLAATLVGIVALGVLLVYVANDALQPFSADPEWYGVFLATIVVPPVAIGAYLARRNPGALVTGTFALGFFAVTLLFAGGAAAVFIDVVPPLVWLSFLVALLVPIGLAIVLTRFDDRIPFLARVSLVGVVGYLSLFGLPAWVPFLPATWGLPHMVQIFPFVPTEWMTMALTLGGPVAAFVGYRWADSTDRRTGITAGVVAFLAIVLAAFVVPAVVGIDPMPSVVLASIALVPTGYYVVSTVVERPSERVGLVLPAAIVLGVLTLVAVETFAGLQGPQSWLDWAFLTNSHSSIPAEAGIYPAIIGTILLMTIVTVLSFPIGVGAAVYLEEYAHETRLKRIIDVNISNLAGVPSVVYGLLGLGVFIRYGGLTPGTVIVGGATLSLLILPIIIISSREAIRAVPDTQLQASYGMGATRWQTVRNVILPKAFPGILTGTILALSRAIGETAPLLVIGAPQIFDLPNTLDSRVGAMPLQLYVWATTFASEEFYTTALAAGVVTLLVVMLAMNSVAIALRNKYQKRG